MTRYFTKPREVVAHQFAICNNENPLRAMPEAFLARRGEWFVSSHILKGKWEPCLILGHGLIPVPLGHWVVIWPTGDLSAHSPEEFGELFEPLEHGPPIVVEWNWPVSGNPGITPIEG